MATYHEVYGIKTEDNKHEVTPSVQKAGLEEWILKGCGDKVMQTNFKLLQNLGLFIIVFD